MSIKTNFFDGNSVAAADLIAPWAAMLSDGVFGATDFAASADSPADLAVSVSAGTAVKSGHFIRSDAAEHVPISANTSGYNRIDVIVLQVDDTGKVTALAVVQGTPSSSPTAPILQANQLPLTQVMVGNNVSVINSDAITDRRIACGSPLLEATGKEALFPSVTAPWGWVAEQGQLLLRAQYPNLWSFAQNSGNIVADGSWAAGNFSSGDGSTTFRLPDKRGYFDRAWDNRSTNGVDSGRALGSIQSDEFKNHSHVEAAAGGGGITPGNWIQVSQNSMGGVGPTILSTEVSGGDETRPKNIARLACIKY